MYQSSKRTFLVCFVLFLFCAVSGTPAFAAPAVSLTSAIYGDNTAVDDYTSVRPGEKITLTFTVADGASVWVEYTFQYDSMSQGSSLFELFEAGTHHLDDDGQMTKTLTIPSGGRGTFTFFVKVDSEKSNEITRQITASDWTDEPPQETPDTSSSSGSGGCSAGFGMVLPVVFALLRKKR
jgi:hypothetical protein